MDLKVYNLYKTEISCPIKNPIDTEMTITITMKDYNGVDIEGNRKNVYIITPSGEKSLVEDVTYSSTITVKYTPVEWGLYTIIYGFVKKQFLCTGWKQYSVNGSFLVLYYNENKVILRVHNDSLSGTNNSWVQQGTIPLEYNFLRPESVISSSSYTTKGEWKVFMNGSIQFRRWSSNSGGEYIVMTWVRRDTW